MKVWMLCEAFALTPEGYGSFGALHDSLTPWCKPCASRRAAMRKLKEAVSNAVSESYEGLEFQDGDDDVVRNEIYEVMSNPTRLGRGIWQWNYSTSDREVVWRVYPSEVMR